MQIDPFIEALRQIDSATVANAIEGLEVRDRTDGYADLRLRRLVAQPEPMVGYAVTCRIDSTTPGPKTRESRYADLKAAVVDSPKPCVVVIEEAGPSPERGCHMGDTVGTALSKIGVIGVVSGSGIRDLDGLREVGLTAFAIGTVVSHGNFTILDVNVEVEVAGLRVRPGDLLHGNGDGLVSVPPCDPARLLELIESVQARESSARAGASSAAQYQ